jgi:hypothetical protein
MNFNVNTGLHDLRLLFVDEKSAENLKTLYEMMFSDDMEIELTKVKVIYDEPAPESPLKDWDMKEIAFSPQIVNCEIEKIFNGMLKSNQ